MSDVRRQLMEGRLDLRRVGSVAAAEGEFPPFVVRDGAGVEIEPVSRYLRDLALSDMSLRGFGARRRRSTSGRPTGSGNASRCCRRWSQISGWLRRRYAPCYSPVPRTCLRQPLVGLAVQLRALGAEVRMCASPDEDFAQLLAGVGVPMVPFGQSARALTTGAPPPSSANLPRHAVELIASQFDAVTTAAEGCDALVATGVMPAAAGARSVAEKLGTIHTDGATVAAALLLDTISRERPPMPA
jgi:hypothetical protein